MENEIRIVFQRMGEALTCRLATSWSGDAGEPRPFAPFLGEADYEDLRWYLEDYLELPLGGVRAERVETLLVPWGRRLFDALFAPSAHRDLIKALVESAPPRLLTIDSADVDVLRLPWELIADGGGPLTWRGITVRRRLDSASQPIDYQVGELPLRILLAVSRPEDAGFLDPRYTTRALIEALEPLGEGALVHFCRPATLDRMERMLDDATSAGRGYHVVHFDGHGVFLPEKQAAVLCFEREENERGELVKTDPVTAERIGRIVAAHEVPLVILEACQSGQMGSVAAFRGVAPALLEAGVGSVLSMSHAVHVDATRILLARFYAGLAAGLSIGAALEEGRGALAAKPERRLAAAPDAPTIPVQDWVVPTLYQRGRDLVLAPRDAELTKKARAIVEPRRAPAKGGEIGAFPPRPRHGFVGRAKELHQLERRFLKHRAVVLHAMGGMGKTALAREAAAWLTVPAGMFPDGACFVSFEHAGGAQRAMQVLGGYFEGVEFERRSAEEQRRRARELFQEKSVLMVWDNFDSVLPQFQEGEAVPPYGDEERAEIRARFEEWTADENGKGRLLVTCRPEETGLGGVVNVALGGLARADALGLLYEIMQKEGVMGYNREELVELLRVLEMHPLSIELVGPHLAKTRPAEIVEDFEGLLDECEDETAAEGRNRSLRASLEFSLKRLSQEAREAVGWLGLFRGGVFEDNLLDVSEIEPGTWDKIRGELVRTALIEVDRELLLADKPYLRFHPTLPHATRKAEESVTVKHRYVDTYVAFTVAIDNALAGSEPQTGMDVMAREETNFRAAVLWAIAQKRYREASHMGDTVGNYLRWSGRLRERDRWAAWLTETMREDASIEALADQEIDEALMLSSRGAPEEAIERLKSLLERLKTTTVFDASFSLATTLVALGRIYGATGRSGEAIAVLEEAVRSWETLIGRAQSPGGTAEVERLNLSVTLSDLASALRNAGRLDDAMATCERGLDIDRNLGHSRNLAAGVALSAQILMLQGRYIEADARYGWALGSARMSGDKELEGILIQSQGTLADEMGQLDRAAEFYCHAIRIFEEMQHDGAIMRTCNLLGVVERQAGRLPEARAWLERSRELASALNDQESFGIAAHNLGLVYQEEGESARKLGHELVARERLGEAVRAVEEGLAIELDNQNDPGIADSCGQLAQIHLLLDNIAEAEAYAQRAREIHERYGLKEAWKTYAILTQIAHARGLEAEASDWERKRDTLLTELHHRAITPAITEDLMDDLDLLSAACVKAGLRNTPLDAEDEASLATIAAWPPPLSAVAPFLRALAAGSVQAVPPGLPEELSKLLATRAEQLRRAMAAGQAPRPQPRYGGSFMRRAQIPDGVLAFSTTLGFGFHSTPDDTMEGPSKPADGTLTHTYLIIPRSSAVAPASAPLSTSRAQRLADHRRELTADTRGFFGRLAVRAPLIIRDAGEDHSNALQSDEPVDPEAVEILKLPALGVLLATGPAAVLGPMAADPDIETAIDTSDLTLEIPEPEDHGISLADTAAWHLDAVGATAAHAAGLDGADLWIGFADTGIDAAHPEFVGRKVLYAAYDVAGLPVQESATDVHARGHGTHVAATAAGRMVGVAPAAQIAMARVFEASGGSTVKQVLAGLEWLASVARPDGEQGVDVLSLSFVSTKHGLAVYNDAYKGIMQRLKSLGITVFGAIGNDGPGRHGSPGNYAEAIGIGAIHSAGNLWSGSGGGSVTAEGGITKPDFVAPGVNIHAALPHGQYGLKTGTSMATPIAAGLGILILQQNGKGADLRTELASRAQPAGTSPAGTPLLRVCF
jgi:tetratricopeptide (TPR) repeat protein